MAAEESREKFEEWAIKRGYNLLRYTFGGMQDAYKELSTYNAWKGWEARDALSDWQPIKTAYTAGSKILLCNEKAKTAYVGCWQGRWYDPHMNIMYPTHWMPLPHPPKEK